MKKTLSKRQTLRKSLLTPQNSYQQPTNLCWWLFFMLFLWNSGGFGYRK